MSRPPVALQSASVRTAETAPLSASQHESTLTTAHAQIEKTVCASGRYSDGVVEIDHRVVRVHGRHAARDPPWHHASHKASGPATLAAERLHFALALGPRPGGAPATVKFATFNDCFSTGDGGRL